MCDGEGTPSPPPGKRVRGGCGLGWNFDLTTPLPQGPPPFRPKRRALAQRNVQGGRALGEQLGAAAAGADEELFPDEEVAAFLGPDTRAQRGEDPNESEDDERRMQQKYENQRRKRVRFDERAMVVNFDSEEPPLKRGCTLNDAITRSPEPDWSRGYAVRETPACSPRCAGSAVQRGTAESGDFVTPRCAGSPETADQVSRGSPADDEASGDSPEDPTNPGASVTPQPDSSDNEE